jgi:hypothetical protein
LFLRAVTFARLRTRMERTKRGGKGTASQNLTYRRDPNGSHDQGRIGICRAGGSVVQPSLYAQDSMKQDTMKQDDMKHDDVHVLLARAEDKALDAEIVQGEFNSVELGALKGNQGDQNYDLPASVDLNKYQAVAIYCERFHAIFAVAKLEKF